MSGIKKLLDAICSEAIQTMDETRLPWWIRTRAIHPDDRDLPGDSPIEQYLNGARFLIVTIDGREIESLREESIERIIRHLDERTLTRLLDGVADESDLDRYAQIGVFGGIKYHKEDASVPHDVAAG